MNPQASGDADGRSLAALLAARRFAAPEVVSGYQDFSPPDPATTPVGLPVEKDRAKLQARRAGFIRVREGSRPSRRPTPPPRPVRLPAGKDRAKLQACCG